MSSDADLDDHTRPSSRRHSSSPDSPRKRPRLRSTEPSRVPKHDQRRKSHAGARYSDDYRVLFNGYVAQAATRFDDDESTLLYSKQVGSSVWSPTEQAVFFAAIERLGKDNVPGIAGAIGSKTPTQVRDHVLMLQDAATKQGDAKLTLRDIPAAIEVGHACENRLEEAGDALAWFQERLEASLEQERYGEYWLITPAIAESIEHDYNGSARPRSASVLQGEEQSSVGSACQQCKAVKRKCDRGTPCSRCTKSGAQCVYVAKKPKVNSRSRTSSPQKLEDKESGSGIAGACTRCKNGKKKCDRQVPCGRCTKSRTDCVYPDNPNKVDDEKFIPPSGAMPIKEDRTEERIEEAGQSGNVATIPEAKLLDPQVMLTLSREIFMNRSPDFPSPWLHWSHYTSEIASEPSIYRTAFNDFHRLAVSITKRLVQVAIIQATSRLRAQRVRNKKGLLPFVKRRDVYTAIDVLRMERNGSERWRGVARRCGLKVISSKTAPGGRRQRQLSVPWAEVERITSPSIGLNERSSWEPETSIEPENFKLRAFRSGTPLPMHNLTLSDGDNDGDIEYVTDIDSEQSSVAPSDSQTSGSPAIPSDDSVHHDNTLEEFDQEARRLEEQALFNMLGLDPVSQKDSTTTGDVEEDADSEVDEKVTTLPDDWRRSLEYQLTWETYRRPVAFAKFSKNRKTASPMPAANTPRETSTRSPSGHLNDASSPNGPTRSMQKLPLPVELRARSTNAYAALQRGAWENEREEDIPTQSIEAGPDESDIGRLVSDMDCA